MDFIYMFLRGNGNEWEDAILFLTKEEAIEQSIRYPQSRVEIFQQKNNNGYEPTYNYYKNGNYIENYT